MNVLHLSDPQFGRYHRHEGPAARILDDLRARGETIDLVAVTGDLAEWAKPKEYTEFAAFLGELCDGLGLARRRALFIPGNHDVSWALLKAYRLECEDRDEKPAPPFWPKWRNYKACLDAWYGPDAAHFLPAEPWSWWELPELDLVVAGFNSTLPETDECHDWAIGERQARWFGERLARSGARVKLGLVHHSPFFGAEAAATERARLRGLPLTLLLHGHTHVQSTEQLPGGAAVLGVGSLGVEKEWREEDVANQYQVLRIGEERCERRLFRYRVDRFLPEDEVLPAGDRDFPLPGGARSGGLSRDGVFGRVVSGDGRMFLGTFAERVAEVLRLREKDAEVSVLDPEAVQVRRGAHRQLYGAVERPDRAAVARFLARLADYRADDPTLPAVMVHRGEAPDVSGVELRSFVRLQGLVDFDALRAWQRSRLAEDKRYDEAAYVPQRIRVGTPHADDLDEPESAFDLVHRLVTEDGDHPRLALVLAPFGTGKTFLVRQLARRLERDWQDGERVPLWIELRHLEKARSFEELLAAHLSRAGQRTIDHHQLDYLRHEGRIVLLFDGFDELVLRVSYDRATEHLETLAAAAEGRARVVVTSRTEHFLRTKDAEGALLRRLSGLSGLRVLHVRPFNREEAQAFLEHRLGEAGRARWDRLARIPRLDELASTPRMLDMLAGLPDADLDAAERAGGEMNAARLYDLVVERWLRGEEEKRSASGSLPPLGWKVARQACGRLAERAWLRAEEDIGQEDLVEIARSCDHHGFTPEEAGRELGVGTLLVRDESARFRFVHRSILEFFVAERCATALLAGEPPVLLDHGQVSRAMVRFLGDLAGDLVDDWARGAARAGSPDQRQANALTIAAERGVKLRLDLVGHDLRGRDDLRLLDLRGADLRGADLRGLDLSEVDLSGADLTGARLDDTRLTRANLDGCVGLAPAWGTSLLGTGFGETELRAEIDVRAPIDALRWGSAGWIAVVAGGAIRIHDETGRPRRTFDREGIVSRLDWSPEGRRLVSGGRDGTVEVWEGEAGKVVARLEGEASSPLPVAWHPASDIIAVGGESRDACVWGLDMDVVRTVNHKGSEGSLSVEWSPDGEGLALGFREGRALVLRNGTATTLIPEAHSPLPLLSLAWSRDGEALFWGETGGRVTRWSANRGIQEWRDISHEWVMTVAMSPDGSALAIVEYSRDVCLVDPASGERRQRLPLGSAQLRELDWSPAGVQLSWGGEDGDLQIWTPLDGELLTPVGERPPTIVSVAWGDSGRNLVCAWRDGTARDWSTDTGTSEAICGPAEKPVKRAFLSPGGARLTLVGADGRFASRSRDGAPFPGPEERPPHGVESAAWSHMGDALAYTGFLGQIHIWSRDQSLKAADTPNDPHTSALAFSPDDRTVGYATWSGFVHLLHSHDLSLVHTFARVPAKILTLSFSPSGTTLAGGSESGHLVLWDLPSRTLTADLPAHRGTIRALAWSPAGDTIATAGDDSVVRLWDAVTLTPRAELHDHRGAVQCLAWSPDGRELLSGGDDGWLRRWDVGNARLLGKMAATAEGSVCVAPDGSHRVTGEVSGWFWIAHGLHRYEVGELDRWLPAIRVKEGEPFPWGRTVLPGLDALATPPSPRTSSSSTPS